MRALKTCLWVAGVLCLLSVLGLVLPIRLIERLTMALGGEPFPDSPQVAYMIRAASATYVAVGVFYVILALRPAKCGPMVPFSGLAAVFVGLVCGITGLSVGLPVVWFVGDFAGCTVLGVLILVFWRRVVASASG